MVHGIKVISAETMQQLEKEFTADDFIDTAANAVYAVIQDRYPGTQAALLLIGKGTKGGIALTVGAHMLRAGVKVFARLLYPTCHPRFAEFKEAGGTVFTHEPFSLVIDGITDTHFRGIPDGVIRDTIDWASAQNMPILAIDFPSGLDGTTGHTTLAIPATITCSLGLPKIGCFIEEGPNYIGRLIHTDIGLSAERLHSIEPVALLFKHDILPIPPISPTQHKYSRGYVLGIGGSPEMPGAAALASLAALRGGAGIVHLFTQAGTPRAILAPEVICETWQESRILEELERADSLFVGPGLGKSSEVQKLLHKLIPHINKPTVFDGDALFPFSPPPHSILTPHRGEMARLLDAPPTLDTCTQWVNCYQTTLILKGVPTFIFHPNKHPLIVLTGDPGMATAGSGDVLTGIMAALLAQKMEPHEAAVLAVYLHGLAGKFAAREKSSYSVIASDIIDCLPEAWKAAIHVQ